MPTGEPAFVRCPKCGRHWEQRTKADGSRYTAVPMYAFRGLVLTGRTRPVKKRGRQHRAAVEVRHERCGHTWWSVHRTFLRRARQGGILTDDARGRGAPNTPATNEGGT